MYTKMAALIRRVRNWFLVEFTGLPLELYEELENLRRQYKRVRDGRITDPTTITQLNTRTDRLLKRMADLVLGPNREHPQ